MNGLKTVLLLGAMTALIMFIGGLVGGRQGMTIALGFAAVFNFFSYWFSDKIVLATYRAKEIDPAQAPRLFEVVQRLAHSAGIPMPRVYLIPSGTPNAFATGRSPRKAVVAVTQGLLNNLDDSEVAAVLAHELSHVKHRDILIGTIAATMAGAIMWLASMARWAAIFGGVGGSSSDNNRGGNIFTLLFMAILAPFAAMLIQMAISRSREFEADAGAAKIVGNPNYLATALEKLEYAATAAPMPAREGSAHMFIVNPLRGGRGVSVFARLFSTHPPTEERVRRLREMQPHFG